MPSVKLGIWQLWVLGEPASSGCLLNCSSLADFLMCWLHFSAQEGTAEIVKDYTFISKNLTKPEHPTLYIAAKKISIMR